MSSLLTSSPTNATEYTVSEISGALKRAVEDQFGNVRVRGEISGYRGPHSSGHAYFALKDDRAKLDAVIWKTTMARLRFRPEEGMEVVATGRLTTFPGKSSYQIVIDRLEPAGAGALMALLEERKRKLQAEGLFDAGRKRKLPFMPCAIGVITSPTGAVIRDIIHRIKDRFPLHVVVWPIRVQGETAGQEAAAAVAGFNALRPDGPIRRPDVLIVARGGGSLEDLWGFNDEALARAVAQSDIPVISAVGHETDWTLIDYAADVRAPTPTGAAEIAVPVRAELQAAVARLAARLNGSISRCNERRRQDFRQTCRALPSPDHVLALPRRRLDEATSRLERGLVVCAERKRARLAGARLSPATLDRQVSEARRHLKLAGEQLPKCARAALRTHRRHLETLRQRSGPEALMRQLGAERKGLARLVERLSRGGDCIVPLYAKAAAATAKRLRLDPLERRLAVSRARHGAVEARLSRSLDLFRSRRRERVDQAWRVLGSFSYQATLRRGFAVVRAAGAPVTRAGALTPGDRFEVQFADGMVDATATGSRPEAAADFAAPAPKSVPGAVGRAAAPDPAAALPPAKPRARRAAAPDTQGSLF